MGYLIRMHHEIRDWLTGLRSSEPELARLVGEAVVAMLDAGETLGPPLVLPVESVLRAADDPRETLDYSYQRQLETLTQVRRGVADVATSRKRIELQAGTVEQQIAKLASQREKALEAGREDLASEVRNREAALQAQLSGLRSQLLSMIRDEEKLTAASQRLQAKVEAFRMQKETIKATYTAAEASQRVREAFAEMGADDRDLETVTVNRAPPGPGGEAGGESRRDAGPEDDDDPPPPGMMALWPGAPDHVRAGLLFVVEPAGTAVLLARVGGSDRPRGELRAAIRLAAARLPDATPDASPGAFVAYDAASFLDEFFPGAETEVEIGAAALAARSRAHTLAQARQRMKLTQAQVADRMGVRQERVSAVERAEPGATEVRTLAAYVRALGGRLEIVAHIGGERVTLR